MSTKVVTRTAKEALLSAKKVDTEDRQQRQDCQDFFHLVREARRSLAYEYFQDWLFSVGMGDPLQQRLKYARLNLIEAQKAQQRDNELGHHR